MLAWFSRPRAALGAAVLVAIVVAGCQPSAEQQVKDAFRREFRENGRRVAFFYAQFMAAPTKPVGPNGFSGPKDEAELRAFIADSPTSALEDMGIKSAAAPELFASERDGRPFLVRYGIKGPLTPYFVLREAQGVNGRVRVFRTDGASVEVAIDEAEAYMTGKHDAAHDPGPAI
jgi:hypothetical protein